MKKITNLIRRDQSVISGEPITEKLLELKDFPVFFGCVDTPAKDDLVADMEWGIDQKTGVIQLTQLIPLEILYREQHVDGFGKTWQEYYADFADYIIKHNPQQALEIGGGSGVLAEIVTSKASDTKWAIIEPNPLHQGNDRIEILKGFFNETFTSTKSFDAVVFSQVMEHAYDPKKFLHNISQFLEPGGKLIFAYPNLKLWLEKKFTNALNFEHTMFLTDYFVDHLLAQYQFKILDKTFYKEHSVFYVAEKSAEPIPAPVLENQYTEYKQIFTAFTEYHRELVETLNNKIASADEPVYLFGAHIFSSFLFAFGLRQESIAGVLDNSALKRDRRFYGTQLIVQSPEVLASKGKVHVILKAGLYNTEIEEQLRAINKDVVIW